MLANFVFFLIFFLFKIINIIIAERAITAINPTPKPNDVVEVDGEIEGTEGDTTQLCDRIGFLAIVPQLLTSLHILVWMPFWQADQSVHVHTS
jgi:hypothetical protein